VEKEYSLSKIIKNNIGYISIFIWITSIICFIITILFISDLYLKIFLYFISIIIFFSILIYSITIILKIKYYFINGIESKAIVVDNQYTEIRRFYFSELGKNLEQNNDISAHCYKWDGRHEYKKYGVIYEYKIAGEIYKSSSSFAINSDTMFIKTGSIINILANPKNKNKAIIKDIYTK
jgi:hypothetical protein